MADSATSGPLPETLKAFRSKLTDMASHIVDLKANMRGMKAHIAAFMQSEVAQDGAIASIQLRIERIEQWLNLADG